MTLIPPHPIGDITNRHDVCPASPVPSGPAPMKRLLWVVVFAIFFAEDARPQNQNLKNYAVQDGLPQSQINCIYQDRTGYLWVGTFSGVARYNGSNWSVFDKNNGLQKNYIISMGEDPEGNLLVGTKEGGVSVFRNGSFHKFGNTALIDKYSITQFLVDRRGALWMATEQGLVILKQGHWKHLTQEDGLPDDRILCLYEDGQGIWVGTGKGIAYLENQQVQAMPIHPLLIEREVKGIARDRAGRLLIATDSGLYSLFDGNVQPVAIAGETRPYHFNSIARGHNGAIWLGTANNGVIGINTKVLRIRSVNGLSHDIVRTVFTDRENNLWIGTDFGLDKFTPGPFEVYREESGLVANFVRALYLDEGKRLWVGTRKGVSIIEPNGVISPFDTSEFPNTQIYSITKSTDGRVIFATNGGLVIHQDGHTRAYTKEDGLPTNAQRAAFTDSRGRVWLGSQGLLQLTDEGFIPFPPEHLLSQVALLYITEDREGWLWLGAVSGLIGYNPDSGAIKVFDDQIDVTVWHLDVDDQNRLWIATNGMGLLRYDGDTITTFNSGNGLSNNFIWQVAAASNGDVWAGHTTGLDRLEGGTIHHYGFEHGIARGESAATAAIEDERGRLWFGTDQGITFYDPQKLDESHRAKPIIHLESVKVLDHSVNPLEKNTFSRNENNLTFQFTALSFRDEGKWLFSYKLEGWVEEWSTPSPNREVKFYNLTPGAYRFRVKIIDQRAENDMVETDYSFRIASAFIETWWFKGIVLCIVVLLIIVYIRVQNWRSSLKAADLKRVVSEKTRELQNANEALKKAQQRLITSAHSAGMAEVATGILHNVGNSMNSINVSVDVIDRTVNLSKAIPFLKRLVGLLEDHRDDLPHFLTNDDQGRKIPQSLKSLCSLLEHTHDRISKETKQLRGRIENVNAIIRTQQDYAKIEDYQESVDLNAVIHDAVQLQEEGAREHQIEIVVELPKLPAVNLPKIKIMQVIINLLKNAVESTASRYKATAKRVHIRGALTDDGELRIEVEDNGLGINPDHRDLIFSYGFSTKKEAQGFGLHFCATAMADMHGRIEVDNKKDGDGAVFTIHLPVQTQTAAGYKGALKNSGRKH